MNGFSIVIPIRWNVILLSRKPYWMDRYEIMHIAQQLFYSGMCKNFNAITPKPIFRPILIAME